MEKKKNKNVDETLEIIKKNLDYNKNAPKYFQPSTKVDKKNQNQNKNLINQFLNGCKCQKIDLIL